MYAPSPTSTGATSTVFEPSAGVGADLRRVLVLAVVVGGDRARADVGTRADLDVAHVGEVRHLRALADVGVLGLDERADVRVGREVGAGAQRHVRADGAALADHRLARHGLLHDRALVHDGVDEARVRADHRAARDRRCGPRGSCRAAAARPARARPSCRCRPRSGSTIVTPSIIQRSLMRSRSTASAVASWARSFTCRAAAGSSAGDRDHGVPGLAEHRHGVGQVVLALRVLGAEPPQRRREQAAAEAVDRGVHLGELELVGVGVGALDDAVDPALRVAHDPAEAPRPRRELGGEQRHRGVGLPVHGGQAGQQLGPDERRVARHDDHVALVVGVVGERGERHARGVAGAPLHVLLDEHDRHVGGDLLLQRLGDPLGAVADDDHDPLERQRAERVDHVEHHRAPAQRVEDLRGGRAHAGALARRHHDTRQGSVPTTHAITPLTDCAAPPVRRTARGRGFEPRLGTPKDPVLPLHHPRRAPIDLTRRALRARAAIADGVPAAPAHG